MTHRDACHRGIVIQNLTGSWTVSPSPAEKRLFFRFCFFLPFFHSLCTGIASPPPRFDRHGDRSVIQ